MDAPACGECPTLLPYKASNRTRSESYFRQSRLRIHVRRDADFPPAICLGCPRCLSLTSVQNGITPDQKVCRQMIALSQTKDHLSHLGRIARLPTPVGSK